MSGATRALPSASAPWDYSTGEISKGEQMRTRSLHGNLLIKPHWAFTEWCCYDEAPNYVSKSTWRTNQGPFGDVFKGRESK